MSDRNKNALIKDDPFKKSRAEKKAKELAEKKITDENKKAVQASLKNAEAGQKPPIESTYYVGDVSYETTKPKSNFLPIALVGMALFFIFKGRLLS